MVGLIVRLTEHADDCTIKGPIIYEYSSREVAEHCMFRYFRDELVSTLAEFAEWRETLAPGELFDIFNLVTWTAR